MNYLFQHCFPSQHLSVEAVSCWRTTLMVYKRLWFMQFREKKIEWRELSIWYFVFWVKDWFHWFAYEVESLKKWKWFWMHLCLTLDTLQLIFTAGSRHALLFWHISIRFGHLRCPVLWASAVSSSIYPRTWWEHVSSTLTTCCRFTTTNIWCRCLSVWFHLPGLVLHMRFLELQTSLQLVVKRCCGSSFFLPLSLGHNDGRKQSQFTFRTWETFRSWSLMGADQLI